MISKNGIQTDENPTNNDSQSEMKLYNHSAPDQLEVKKQEESDLEVDRSCLEILRI